jgi:hypothetical protein
MRLIHENGGVSNSRKCGRERHEKKTKERIIKLNNLRKKGIK